MGRDHIWALIAILILASITGCTSQEIKATAAPAGDLDPPHGPIVIGVDMPLTGPLAIYGTTLTEGIELGVEDLNSRGGINGTPVRLSVQDNHGNPADAITAARMLMDNENAAIIMSTMVGPTGAIVPITEEREMIVLYAAASGNFAKQNHFVFKDSVDAGYDCALLGSYARANDSSRIARFGAQGEFTQNCKDSVENIRGIDVSIFEKYDKGDQDFTTSLTKIKQDKPSGVVISAYSDDCVNIWRKIKEIGLNATFLVPFAQTGCGDERSLPEMRGVGSPIIGLDFEVSKDGEEFKAFNQSYNRKFTKEPSMLFFTALGYDWAHYASRALEQCDEPINASCLQRAIEKTDHTGAWGRVRYNTDHTTQRPLTLIEYKNGAWARSP